MLYDNAVSNSNGVNSNFTLMLAMSVFMGVSNSNGVNSNLSLKAEKS